MLTRISAEQFADILDVAEDGVVTVNARHEIVLYNGGAAKLFGYAADEVLGRPLDVLIPARYHATHPGLVQEFATGPQQSRTMAERRTVYGRRKDGTEFPVEITISRLLAGDELLLTAIVRDAAARKRYEDALVRLNHDLEERVRTGRELNRAVLDSLAAHIAVLDRGGAIIAVNSAWERFAREHGGDPGACGVGTNYLDVCDKSRGPYSDEAPAARDGIRTVLAGERPTFRMEYPCAWLDRPRWFTLHVTPLGEDRRGAVVSHTDITERKRAEDAARQTTREREQALAELGAKTEELRATTQQLWQAARLAGVGELAASIAHELNNPLGTVSLRIEGVLAKTPADDPRRRPLEVVEQEVARMARLVSNLLNFSRAGREQVSTVDVCDEVTRTIELTDHHLRRHGVRVEPDFAPGVPKIYADRQHLRQVFLNLFTNAADAMPHGGRIVPRVRPGELPGARPAVVIEVADTGHGIRPEHLPRVTDPFFTTKEEGKGTGLGLAICKRIVQQHHGKLEVESEVGRGTTVRVVLPVRTDSNVAGLG